MKVLSAVLLCIVLAQSNCVCSKPDTVFSPIRSQLATLGNIAAKVKCNYNGKVDLVGKATIHAKSIDAGDPIPTYWYTKVLPVHPSELAKFFSLSFMMFWIVYIFTIARDTKDALIVTNCGAESIAFLKVYGVVPAATIFMLVYSNLASRLSSKTLFYLTIAPFMVFYAIFAFVLYPLRHALHPMSIKVPEGGMSFAVNLLRHWTFSLYYIVSELWGSAGVPLLFWSCANDVIRIDQVTYSICCALFYTYILGNYLTILPPSIYLGEAHLPFNRAGWKPGTDLLWS